MLPVNINSVNGIMILAVSRAECFSPNSVGKDAAILREVSDILRRNGHNVGMISEESLSDGVEAGVCLSMARSRKALETLRRKEAAGVAVINSVPAVEACCNRRLATRLMAEAGVRVPAESGKAGYWLKRADGTAQQEGDVCFAATKAECDMKMEEMRRRGIADIMVSAHVEGDLIKFYGVCGTGFFRTFYPCDDCDWKFSNESRNGTPHHYCFNAAAMQAMAERAAGAVGAEVYGGDCIVSADGTVTIIDLNDWPSFSRCRTEAAMAIAALVEGRIKTNSTSVKQ